MLDHFKFLKAHARAAPKMTIPSPASAFPPRAERRRHQGIYADRDAIFDDLAEPTSKAIRAFYDAGCRYLQFDDTVWAYLCSQAELQEGARARARTPSVWRRTTPASSTGA